MLRRDERSQSGIVETAPHRHRVDRPAHLLHDLVVHGGVDQQPRACGAGLPRVLRERPDQAGNRSADVREHDVGGLAAQFQNSGDDAVRGGVGDERPGRGRSDEAQVRDPGVLRKGIAGLCTQAHDDVEGSRGESGLMDELCQSHRGAGRLVRRLRHGAVPGGQGRRSRPADELQRVVPRDDVPRHPVRLATGVDVHVVAQRDLVAVVGLDRVAVEVEVPGADVHVRVCLHQRLARVLRFQPRQLLAVRADERSGRHQQLRALLRRAAAPLLLRRGGRVHGCVDLVLAGPRDLTDLRTRRGIDVGVGPQGRQVPSADEGCGLHGARCHGLIEHQHSPLGHRVSDARVRPERDPADRTAAADRSHPTGSPMRRRHGSASRPRSRGDR